MGKQTTGSPEDLHNRAKSTAKATDNAFMNEGIPAGPIVTKDQMTSATIKGDGAKKLTDAYTQNMK